MKLYTEEQVKKAIDLGRDYYDGFVRIEKDIIDELTPLELPSDDKIEKVAEKTLSVNFIGFIKGAKWMKEQILKNNL